MLHISLVASTVPKHHFSIYIHLALFPLQSLDFCRRAFSWICTVRFVKIQVYKIHSALEVIDIQIMLVT